MNLIKLCLLVSLAAVTATAPDTAETAAKAKTDKPTCAIRELQQQVCRKNAKMLDSRGIGVPWRLSCRCTGRVDAQKH